MQKKDKFKGPPKLAIANGFAMGEFPDVIKRHKPTESGEETRKVNAEDFTDEMRAIIAARRPYGCICAFTGGQQKSIYGTVSYYETDVSEIGGVFNHARENLGLAKDIYVMLCGRFTPEQRRIVSNRVMMDTELYMDIVKYFIEESGHPGYDGMPLVKDFPSPVFIADNANENNTDISIDSDIEKIYAGGTYYLSTAQDPSHKTSVLSNET